MKQVKCLFHGPTPKVEKIIKKETGSKTKIVHLSDSTIESHKFREKRIGKEEYRKLPEIINDPEVVVLEKAEKDVQTVLFYKTSQDRKFETVIKVTAKKDEMFVQTLHDTKKIRKKKGKVVYEKKK